MQPKLTPEQRFWSKVDPCRTDGCMIWIAALDQDGYGAFWLGGKMTKAHHFLVGKPPTGLVSDHVRARGCFNRACVAQEHLEAVTHQVNMSRGQWALKTHCPKGHSYDVADTYIDPRGKRQCRICRQAHFTTPLLVPPVQL